jgi:hypothetical protein
MKLKTFEDITGITGTPTDQKIVDGVRDILIELEDEGFLVQVGNVDDDDFGNTFVGEPLNIEENGLLMIEITKRMPNQQYYNFKYSDVSEYILTVIDFMKERWTYVKVIYDYETFNLEDGFKRHRDSKPKLIEDIQKLRLFIRKEKPTMMKRFLKKFEAFSMNVDVCPRCGESTNNQTTMSVFNTDTICITCKDKEKEDPDYQLAVDTETEEVRKGNYNYPGIYPNYKPLVENIEEFEPKNEIVDDYLEILTNLYPIKKSEFGNYVVVNDKTLFLKFGKSNVINKIFNNIDSDIIKNIHKPSLRKAIKIHLDNI